MHTPDLREIRYFLKQGNDPIDDRIFDTYEEAEKALNGLRLLVEDTNGVNIDSYIINKGYLKG
jgi:hypothetical protein